uniref:Si:dkey-86e18.1 n=1 Tax=Neogobius melanostomus TaxID=47308 RepID=A0A8C6T8B4_9GOBI
MARNEEKQQGRLNRLWLQKEKEEGRLKDTRQARPKLCTLNTAASVKRWIPSIKNEIEYYLQQSQLTHYPERKIAEFQLKIEALEKEYKSFITKLRVLDPSCKHHPWTPRAYCKRRTDQQDSHTGKKPFSTSTEGFDELIKGSSGGTSAISTNPTTRTREMFQSESRALNKDCCNLDIPNGDQDLPLSFDQSRLAVAVAPFRGSSAALELTQTNALARVLQSGLPNLANSAMRYSNHQNLTDNNQTQLIESTKQGCSDVCKHPVPLREEPYCTSKKQATGTSLASRCPLEAGHGLLGLDCYSSSDDEDESCRTGTDVSD